jgi:hypothetical protein
MGFSGATQHTWLAVTATMAAQRAMAAVQRQAAAAAATTSAAAPAATVRTDAAAELRHAAITRGLRWMERFLADRRVLFELDEQMIGAFFDVFTTQTDPAVCELAKELALSTLNRLLPRLLNAHKANAMPRESFLDLLALCRYRRLGWDPEPAMQRADRAYAAMKKRTEAAASTSGPARTSKALVLRKLTSALFGVRLEQLGSCTTKMWFELLMFVFYVEFANSCYPGRFPVAWGMREALAALRTHRFVPPPWSPTSDFSECFYLATHVTYYLSCYTTNRREEMPWLYEYVELSMEFWMAQLRRRKSGERGEATDGLVYTDLEGVAEGLDVLRGLQPPSEPPTPTVIEATEWLLDQQKEDGSWAAIWHPKDPLWPQDEYDRLYFAIHPTWVTVCVRPPKPSLSTLARAVLASALRTPANCLSDTDTAGGTPINQVCSVRPTEPPKGAARAERWVARGCTADDERGQV